MHFKKLSDRDAFLTAELTGALDAEAARSAFRDVWSFFVCEIEPNHNGIPWDYVRVEVWSDSSRLLLFPATNGVNKRIEKSGLQVVLRMWNTLWDQMDEDGVSDEEFTAAVRAEEAKVAKWLLEAANGVIGKRINVFSGTQPAPFATSSPR